MKVRAVTAAAAAIIIKTEYGSCVSIKATYLSLEWNTQINTSSVFVDLAKFHFLGINRTNYGINCNQSAIKIKFITFRRNCK